jgi:hypothetical protein
MENISMEWYLEGEISKEQFSGRFLKGIILKEKIIMGINPREIMYIKIDFDVAHRVINDSCKIKFYSIPNSK